MKAVNSFMQGLHHVAQANNCRAFCTQGIFYIDALTVNGLYGSAWQGLRIICENQGLQMRLKSFHVCDLLVSKRALRAPVKNNIFNA